jgi:hypothetical protein
MSATVYKAQDIATIRATIENEGIDPITGRPDCLKLIEFLNQVSEGAKQVECEYSNFGMMWVCLPQDIYLQITQEHVTAPINPPLVPPYNEHGTPAYNAQVQVTWQKNKELSDQRKNTDKALIEIAKSKLDPSYRRTLTQMFTGLPDRRFLDLFGRMWTKWGNPTPHDITANEERMKLPWDPNERDIADVIKQINDGNLFAYFVGHRKPDNDLVTIGEKIILDTGLFAQQYGQWRKIDAADRTWAKFDEFWTAEMDLWHETTRTAAQHGYGGNISGTTNETALDEAEQAYYNSLQKFGEANRDNAATFNSLAATNSHLANNMAAEIKNLQQQNNNLQQQMQQLLIAVNRPNAPLPMPIYSQPMAYAAMPPTVPQPAPQGPMPQAQYQNYGYQQGARGGRQGGRARGYGYSRGPGRGRNYQQRGYQQNTYPNPQYYTQNQQGGRYNQQGTGGFYKQQSPMNPVKFFKNWNYCWSCGFDVPDWHTSASCPNPREGHVATATRDNPCNGCMKAAHKTQM